MNDRTHLLELLKQQQMQFEVIARDQPQELSGLVALHSLQLELLSRYSTDRDTYPTADGVN